MNTSIVYNVDYNIPKVNISLPGRQNRSRDDTIRITPGMTEPFEFNWGNMDGVPINLTPFKAKFSIWKVNNNDPVLSIGQSTILINKDMTIQEPYYGKCVVILTEDDTILLGSIGGNLRWSIFLINSEDQVFPAEVGPSKKRYGSILLDLESGIPVGETIRHY